MGIFSRLGDIINSNINTLLDKAEDPEKIARLIIQEMEDTLVELRTHAARSIAERKDLARRLERHRADAEEWTRKAELALEKGREDLARGALQAKQKALRASEAASEEFAAVEDAIAKADEDLAKLQAKLDEAKAKQNALATRRQSAEQRIKARATLADASVDDALERYAMVERKVDDLEARAEVFDLGQGRTLESEFATLESADEVEAELAALKQRMGGRVARPAVTARCTEGDV